MATMPNCIRTLIPKFLIEMLLFNLGQGLSFFWKVFFLGGMYSFIFIEAKNEEKLKKLFSFDQVKNKFAHLGGLNKIQFFF